MITRRELGSKILGALAGIGVALAVPRSSARPVKVGGGSRPMKVGDCVLVPIFRLLSAKELADVFYGGACAPARVMTYSLTCLKSPQPLSFDDASRILSQAAAAHSVSGWFGDIGHSVNFPTIYKDALFGNICFERVA